MTTGLVYHDHFLEHDPGPGHPERPDRLRVIMQRLRTANLRDGLHPLNPPSADLAWIERLHAPTYVERVFEACRQGRTFIDSPDSAISTRSAEVAQRAVGGVFAAVDAVMAHRVDNAFCAVRPPGHHAEHDRSMGFCLFNHVALAAEYALTHHGLNRVAILDFDVHHGNGTQHLFEQRDDVLYVSLHEDPRHLFPGTGDAHETGVGRGVGYTLNLPMDPGMGDEQYGRVVDQQALPAMERFAPDLLLLSAGFDAAGEDPLAHMQVTPDGFEAMTRRIASWAREHCDGRLISVLEGGYDLSALAEAAARHVRVLREAGSE